MTNPYGPQGAPDQPDQPDGGGWGPARHSGDAQPPSYGEPTGTPQPQGRPAQPQGWPAQPPARSGWTDPAQQGWQGHAPVPETGGQPAGRNWGEPQGYGGPPRQSWGGQPQFASQAGQDGAQYGEDLGQPRRGGSGRGSGGGRGRWIALGAVAVVLIGGGVATYAAVSSSNGGDSGGASSPQKAIATMVTDLNNSDIVGALNDLVPSEQSAITKPFLDTVNSLKKNDVLTSDADLSHLSGLTFKLTDATYGAPTSVNDHVQVVPLTGGTLTVSGNAAELPLTSDVLAATHAHLSGTKTQTVDIAKQEKANNQTVLLATEKSGSSWYPSLLYTIAANVVASDHLQAPTAADRIPDVGGSSPDDAVRTAITALLSGNVTKAIEVASPDELGVLHDYGKLIVDRAHYSGANLDLKNLQFSDTAISGGTRVSLKSLSIAEDGQDISVAVSGSCYTLTVSGQSHKECLSSTITQIAGASSTTLTAEQRQALTDLFTGVTSVGVDVTQTDGKFYVNPVRSYLDLTNELLGGLKGDDGKVLLQLVSR